MKWGEGGEPTQFAARVGRIKGRKNKNELEIDAGFVQGAKLTFMLLRKQM